MNSSPQVETLQSPPLRSTSPVVKVEVRPVDEPCTRAQVNHFDVTASTQDGTIVFHQIQSIEARLEQTVLGVLPYFQRDGEWYCIVEELPRAPLAARGTADVPGTDPHSGVQRRLPGQYLTSDQGIAEYAGRLINERLGLQHLGKPISLGSSFPSARTSTEQEIVRGMLVEPSEQMTFIRPEPTPFIDNHRIITLTFQEAVDQFFRGEIPCIRFIDALLRFADRKGISLNVPEPLQTVITASPRYQGEAGEILFPIASTEEIREIADGRMNPIQISYTPVSEPPADPYLRQFMMEAKNIRADGSQSEPYNVECVAAQKGDHLSAVVYFVDHSGEPYIYVNFGRRIAKVVQRDHKRVFQEDQHPTHLELAGGSLGTDSSVSRDERLIQLVTASTGLTPLVPPFLAATVFPSAGFNCNAESLYFYPIDPTQQPDKVSTATGTSGSSFVRARDVRLLVEQGYIRDPFVSVGAAALLLAFRKEVVELRDPQQEALIERFNEMIHEGSHVHRLLGSVAPDTYRTLYESSSLFRRGIAYLTNNAGYLIRRFDHPKEEEFFAPLYGIYSLLPKALENPELLPVLVGHDLRHQLDGEVIPIAAKRDEHGRIQPLLDEEGNYQFMSFEDYHRLSLMSELSAVLFSDVTLYDSLRGKHTFAQPFIGEIFEKAGIPPERALEALFQIEGEGIVPPEILTLPNYFAAESPDRNVIQHRLLLRHLLDEKQNLERWRNWVENPEVALTALEFSAREQATESAEEYLQHHNDIGSLLERYGEGINPLKGYLSNMLLDVRILALRLKFYEQQLPIGEARELCHAKVDELRSVYLTLKKTIARVKSIDPTKENLAAFLYGEQLQKGFLADLSELSDQLTQCPELSSFNGRYFPYLDPFPAAPTWHDHTGIAILELKSLQRAGLPVPKPAALFASSPHRWWKSPIDMQ